MVERDFYQQIKERLGELFLAKGKQPYFEITAKKGLSEKLKEKIPHDREILFVFLKKKPDIFGFVEEKYTKNFITVEIKEKISRLDDIYQAKLYKDVFDAKYGFLVVLSPIQDEIKRLCKNTLNILRSYKNGVSPFLTLAQFDKSSGKFVDWFEENPFEKDIYWK
jgi:hypothetical protein